MKITKDQIVKAYKKAERDLDIEFGANINHHRVHKSKKAYDRNKLKKYKNKNFDPYEED